MANIKEFTLGFEVGATTYFTVQRRADGYLLDDADGAFRSPPVTDFSLALADNSFQPGLYEATEARTSWTDGAYLVCFYLQLGGSPAPTTDPMLASKGMTMLDDTEVAGDGNTTVTVNDSSVRNVTESDADLAELKKLVKAILHDNKMVLDKVEAMKGAVNGHPGEKEGRSPRSRS